MGLQPVGICGIGAYTGSGGIDLEGEEIRKRRPFMKDATFGKRKEEGGGVVGDEES